MKPTMSKVLFVLTVGALLATGCKSRESCRPDTVLVMLPCEADAMDSFRVVTSLSSGGTAKASGVLDVPATCPETTLQLNVADYVAGDALTIEATPTKAGKAVAAAMRFSTTTTPGCTVVTADELKNGAQPKPDGGTDAPPSGDAGSRDDGSTAPACNSGAQNLALGAACSCDAQCGSGNCVDGVCCDGKCGATCMMCNVPGKMGICSFVPDGIAPRTTDECKKEPESSCGLDGTCNGAGSCRKWDDGTTCQPGRCEGSEIVEIKQCRAGECVAGAKKICAPYGCDNAATRCFDSCDGNTQCAAGKSCQAGSCGKKPIGATCANKDDCESGFCADGVCCATACTGACMACNTVGAPGECVNVPAGQQDPHKVCADQGKQSCGTSGVCDGQGQCAKYASGTVCGDATCSGNAAVPAATCDGKGTCVPGAAVACAPFACAGGACRTTCAGPQDCLAPNVCAAGSCGKRGLGQNCSGDGECESNHCADGVCCMTACAGACKSCNLAQTKGTCTNVTAGAADPHGVCKDAGATSCGQNGACNGSGGCQLYPANTKCGVESCSSDSYRAAPTCDGSGTCRQAAAQPCAPNRCNGTKCGVTCNDDGDCVPPNTCSASGSCGKKPNGAVCSTDAQCESGACSQGYCCNVKCSDSCKSCGLPNSRGTCINVPAGGADPAGVCVRDAENTCGNDGTCDGDGRCRKGMRSQTCGSPRCSGNSYTAVGHCSGSGSCELPPAVACNDYACRTSGCATSCTNQGDCAASADACITGKCARTLSLNLVSPTGTTFSYGDARPNELTMGRVIVDNIQVENAALMTFDLSGVPANSVVLKAEISFVFSGCNSPNPFDSGKKVQLSHVDYGATLINGPGGYAQLGSPMHVMDLMTFDRQVLDVTTWVSDDIANRTSRANRAQFITRFDNLQGIAERQVCSWYDLSNDANAASPRLPHLIVQYGF
jgi:hypothetical protein